MAKISQVKSRRKQLNPVFHLQTKEEDDNQLTNGMIKVVRKTGQLNLSGRNLATVPNRMFTIYELDGSEANINYDLGKSTEESWWNFKPLIYLDLSSNVINELPNNISIFQDLTTLNLQDNNLTALPKEVGALTRLTKLNISHNKINQLPKEFYNLTELQDLNASYNQLENLTANMGDLVMLQQLDLSYNLLTNLPSGMGYLVRIIDLNLSHNKLTELPPDIVNLRVLQKLDVTYNNLQKLPKLGEMRKLQFLYAQHNDINELPDMEGSEHVEQLYFGNNFIKELPKDFFENIVNVKILDLRDNQIEDLPDEVAMLQKIIRLDLTNNELSTLPNSMGLLPHLQNLQIEGNKFKNVRQDMIKGGTTRLLKHLRDKFSDESMKIVNTNVSHIPYRQSLPDKYAMRNARSLNYSMKDLSNVPEEAFQDALWAEATSVDLSQNKLESVPNGLTIIAANVTEIELSKNLLKTVPATLSECSRLQYLNLGNNLLTNLPDCLNLLKQLREIVLSNNRFTIIPECVYGMESLEIFLISDNQISELNIDGLKNLKRVATLDLTNNNINHVPPELGNLKHIKSLELKGNSFRQPRYAILEQGTETILSYLRDRIPQ